MPEPEQNTVKVRVVPAEPLADSYAAKIEKIKEEISDEYFAGMKAGLDFAISKIDAMAVEVPTEVLPKKDEDED